MFAYCNNNPSNASDPTGMFSFAGFAGAIIGGAIAGALISTVSCIVSCGLNGEAITKEKLFDAAKSGAISGAIGGAIGTISIGAKVVTAVQKFAPGVTSKMLNNGVKAVASLATSFFLGKDAEQAGITVASGSSSTFLGSLIDATTDSVCSSAFCNYSATLFVGTAIEVVTVGAKQIGRFLTK